MKKIAFTTLLFLLACLPMFSQVRNPSKIYVPPVAGYGMPEDNEFFQQQVFYEVTLQYHDAVSSKRGSQYTLKGLIEPYTGEVSAAAAAVHIPDKSHPVPARATPRVRNDKERREFFTWEVNGDMRFYDSSDDVNLLPPSNEPPPERFNADDLEFIFYLALVNNNTDQAMGEQYIIYKVLDDSVSKLVSVMVQNMLSFIPVDLEKGAVRGDDFRHKWLYLDAILSWAPSLYSGDDQSFSWLTFGGGIGAEFHFVKFMSLGLGLQIKQDWVVVTRGVDEHRDLIMEIPLTLRYVVKPADTYMIEPYTGVNINISLQKNTKPSLFSLLVGCQIGIDMGPGMLVIDPRVAIDFLDSTLKRGIDLKTIDYRRYKMQVGLGYKFGFFEK